MSVAWSNLVNNKFYDVIKKPKDNAVVNENISGRTVSYNANTRFLYTYSALLSLRKKNELDAFWLWYTSVLGGLSGEFTCSSLGNGVYRFVSVPEPSTSSNAFVELSLEIEEVY